MDQEWKNLKSPYWFWQLRDFTQCYAALTIPPPPKKNPKNLSWQNGVFLQWIAMGAPFESPTAIWGCGMRESKDHVAPQPPPPSCSQPWAHWAAQSSRNWAQALPYVLIQDAVSLTAPFPEKAEQSAFWRGLKRGGKINKEKLHICLRFFQYVS